MRQIYLTVALLMLVSPALAVALQVPSPSPTKTVQEPKQKHSGEAQQTKPIRQPSQQAPASINLPEAPQTKKKSNDSSSDHNEKAVSDWITGFTGALVLLALLQFIAMWLQARYMRQGLSLTKQAAEAATLSANTAKSALEITERADVLIDRVEISSIIRGQLTEPTVINITLKNFGRTRADSVISSADLTVQGASVCRLSESVSIVLAANAPTSLPFSPLASFLGAFEIDKINAGTNRFEFSLEIRYRDAFGANHHVSAGGLYNRVSGRFDVTHSKAS